jgi:hypothetical protein
MEQKMQLQRRTWERHLLEAAHSGGKAAVTGGTHTKNGSCQGLNVQEERQLSMAGHTGGMAAVGG